MEAHVLRRITNRLPSERINTSSWDHFDRLQLADPNYNVPGEIYVLLGAQVCSEILCAEIRRGERGQPIGKKTSLGWIVFGGERLDELLQRFWSIDDIVESQSETKEDELCEANFQEHVSRDKSGRYVVRIPIKSKAPALGD